MSRKTILIPAVELAEPEHGELLELLIEPAGLGAGTEPQLELLYAHGLGVAVAAAQAALSTARLPPARSWIAPAAWLGPPVLYLANPRANLSNAAGAALGIALGLLMYAQRCPGQRLLATGALTISAASPVKIGPDRWLAAKLKLALTLESQEQPLLFLVPAQVTPGVPTQTRCAVPIAALARLKIHVVPVNSLEEAVAACEKLAER
ncbi:MAG: hypothetical protein U1F76_32280 [Candidatus Competibacteraceae bacterium]